MKDRKKVSLKDLELALEFLNEEHPDHRDYEVPEFRDLDNGSALRRDKTRRKR